MNAQLPAPKTEVVLYLSTDGKSQIGVTLQDETAWLSQKDIAELFQVKVPTVNEHLKNVFAEGELAEKAVIRNFRITAEDGKAYLTKHYNLDAILAVGYRVRSPRGMEFRQWATATLREYLVKGFVMNDERLKEPAWDYFDELLERIRDIRASEKRFYQKVRELFALSRDYKDDPKASQRFFAEVQNKMLFAVTGHTAAELVVQRADPDQPNMGLQSWKRDVVRKADVIVAKNYLRQEEISNLNRIVTMFLDYAEDRVSQRRHLTLADWQGNTDRFLAFNERPVLDGPGKISHDKMKTIAHQRYDAYDGKRKRQEALDADAEDIKALEELERQLEK